MPSFLAFNKNLCSLKGLYGQNVHSTYSKAVDSDHSSVRVTSSRSGNDVLGKKIYNNIENIGLIFNCYVIIVSIEIEKVLCVLKHMYIHTR